MSLLPSASSSTSEPVKRPLLYPKPVHSDFLKACTGQIISQAHFFTACAWSAKDLKPKYNELLHMNHLWMESSPNLFPSLEPKESPNPRPNPDSICFKALNCHFTCMLIGWRPHPKRTAPADAPGRDEGSLPRMRMSVYRIEQCEIWGLRIVDCGEGVEAAVLWGELGVQECDLLFCWK